MAEDASALTVVLVTNVFPFGKGEEFIDPEIAHLARNFDRVIIVATQAASDAPQTRELPDNFTVVRAGSPRPSGLSAAVMIAQGGLARLGHPVDLPRHPKQFALEAFFEGRAQNSWRQLRFRLDEGLGDQLLSSGPVLVYSYWLHITARVALLLSEWLKSCGVTVNGVISRAHRYDLYEDANPHGYIPERRLLLDELDRVYPISSMGAAHLRESFPEYANKIEVRRLGCADPGEQVVCRQDPARLVSCSYLLPVKRVDRIPAVLEAASRRLGSPVAWMHFGDGESRGDVEAEISARGLGECCTLAGYVSNKELSDRYRHLVPSAFINVSSSEGIPVSIMEAIALGIPVIATDVGGVAEIVTDGENGFLLPKDFTVDQAADAVVRLLTMPADDYDSMCRRSRRVWEDNYDAEANFAAFDAEIARLGAHG